MSEDTHQEGRKKVDLVSRKAPPLRILQVLVAAACGLLFLKVIGLMTNGGYVFTGGNAPAPDKQFARVLSNIRTNSADDGLITGSSGAAKKDEPKKTEEKDVKMPTDFKPPEKPLPPQVAPSELQVLQRLRERRDSLEQRSQELEMRENLLKAAEKKLESRFVDASAPGAAVNAAGEVGKPPEEPKQMKNLVIIYESMKPKDAARVFDKLDLKILVSVIKAMNPRKVSEIVAAMSPEVAQRVTVALATRSGEMEPPRGEQQGEVTSPEELPRVDLPSKPRAP